MSKKTPMTEMSIEKYKEMKVMKKKFVSPKEGADLYSMSADMFRKYADDARAVYRMGKRILINTEIFEEYLETFRVWGVMPCHEGRVFYL